MLSVHVYTHSSSFCPMCHDISRNCSADVTHAQLVPVGLLPCVLSHASLKQEAQLSSRWRQVLTRKKYGGLGASDYTLSWGIRDSVFELLKVRGKVRLGIRHCLVGLGILSLSS